MYSRGILFLFFILPGFLNAQPGFNRIYRIYGAIDNFSRLIVDTDTLYCIGTAYDTMNLPSPLQVQMVKMDSSGNVIKSRLYKDSLNDFLGMDFLFGEIIKTSRGYFAFPVTAFNRASYLWIQVDKDLEIKAISKFQSPNDLALFDETIIEMPDTGFLIAGNVQRPNLKQDGFIRRVDKHGNLMWFKYYGDYGKDESIRDIVKVSDNRFVLCGGVGPNSNDPKTARAGLWVS